MSEEVKLIRAIFQIRLEELQQIFGADECVKLIKRLKGNEGGGSVDRVGLV